MMSRKLKINLILSTAAMLLPALAGLILWNRLPDSVPIHWNAFGEVDGYGSKLFIVAGLPALFLLFHIIVTLSLVIVSKKSEGSNNSGLAVTMWLMPIIVILTSAFVYCAGLNIPIDANLFFPVVVCLIFTISGFILLRYPNLKAINFPTKSISTRRFSGIVLMVCSIISAVLSFFKLYYIIIPIAFLCVVVPTIYHFTKGRYIG